MIAFNYDYTASVRLILDFESFTMRHILQVNINDLFKAISIHENVLKMRISGIEILNAPHVISVILNLAKICLKPKLISRLSVHNNVESLSKSISKKYLPADYGGEQPNIQTLIAMCESTFLDKKDFFQKIERLAEQNQTRGEIFGLFESPIDPKNIIKPRLPHPQMLPSHLLHHQFLKHLQIGLNLLIPSIDQLTERCFQLAPVFGRQIGLVYVFVKRLEDRVRKNIENYFSYLSRYPEMFTGFANLRPVEEVGVAVLLPVPTTTWERIAILKLQPDKVGKVLDVHRCLAIGLATAMIAFNYDYSASVRLILDFESFTMSHILQVNINDLFKAISIHENVLKMRISGIEILNAPHVISVILNLAKICLKPKLISRLSVHNNVESLCKNISKKYLPADYGGEQPNIQTLIAMCESTFLDKKEFFQRIERLADKTKHEGRFSEFKDHSNRSIWTKLFYLFPTIFSNKFLINLQLFEGPIDPKNIIKPRLPHPQMLPRHLLHHQFLKHLQIGLNLLIPSIDQLTERCFQLAPVFGRQIGLVYVFVKRLLLRGKFKEDRVRKNIENYFTYLSRYPEMFTGFANLRPVEEVGVAVLLPVPTTTWERIAILKLQPDKVGKVLDVHRCLAIGLATAMIAFNYDYTASVRLILDFESFTMSHILQVNINDLFKAISIHEVRS
ncbi:hypothetical protein TcasGA2_TC033428 [Tribolium castaneum]|uniref:CRAL-TRIO domain-containing protein n=1 Tax=Tribolium castaneum TaxID=7070 RepID=A0A139WG55_TRICA|nr:hypothetical protein TcasGA2_TC033428 [Tribolium castaneum]